MEKGMRIQPTKKQLGVMKKCWKLFQKELDHFYMVTYKIEKKMSKEAEIKDLEFFQSDGDWCGIGNGDRTMGLLQRDKLED